MAENNNALNDLIMGMGALAEMAGLMRENLIKNGFTRKEACAIVSDFIINTVSGNTNNKK